MDDLAVIESGRPPRLIEELTDQSDNGGKKEPEPDKPDSPDSSQPPSPLTPIMSDSNFEKEGRFVPENPIPKLPTQSTTQLDPAPSPPKSPQPEPRASGSSKWANLPPRESSTRTRREPEHYGTCAATADIDAATSGHIHTAFVAYASESCTVQEALRHLA